MKKIFLIPLLTLMCSITAWADGTITRVDVSTKAELDAALAAAAGQDSTEITLTGDITITDGVFNVPSGAHVLLNLNGNGMTSTFVQPDDGADISQDALIYNQGTLHIISEGSSIVQKTTSTTYQPAVICNKGNLIIDGGIFISGSVWEPFMGMAWKNPVIWGKGASSNIIINGGTFLHDESYSDHARGPILPVIATGGGTLTVTGGIFSTSEENYNKHHHAAADLMGHYDADKYTTIEVPYTNEKIPGYTSDRQNHIRTNNNNGNSDYRTAPKKVCMVVPTNADPDNFLYVTENTTITVPDGETLRVGEGGIVMGDATSKIIIEAGGKLISEGEIVTSTPDNLHLTMDEVNKKYSYVAFNTAGPSAKHPDATVVLKTKAKCEGGVYTYQRFAVPTYLNTIARKQSAENTAFTYDKVAAPTAIYRWDYSADDWTVLAPAGDDTFEPFQGYDLTTSATAAGTEYTFKCELVGRGNAVLPLQANKKWQYFANSYTAPIDVATLVTDLYNNKSSYLNAGVWVHRINGNGWDAISWADVEDHLLDGDELYQELIQPMQAFVYNLTGSAASTELDYDNLVFNPMLSAANSAAGAPRRRVANVDYTRATIAIEAADGTKDLVKVYEGSEFDATINNGYDMPKLMNEEGVNIYFNAAEGDLARFASDNVANTAITLETKEATSYTVSFSNVTLAGYALRDNMTGTETELVSGNTYSFSAPANSKVEGRFEIVAVAKMPTAIDDVEVNANVKGIYTLTGQYMGENFHALPAGVYVINGKKVVK